ELISLMAERQVGLVPTLINIARFPEIAERGGKYPKYAEHMRALHRTVGERVGAAYEAGVPIYAGTDAGSDVVHGRIAHEIMALPIIGASPCPGPLMFTKAARSRRPSARAASRSAPTT